MGNAIRKLRKSIAKSEVPPIIIVPSDFNPPDDTGVAEAISDILNKGGIMIAHGKMYGSMRDWANKALAEKHPNVQRGPIGDKDDRC